MIVHGTGHDDRNFARLAPVERTVKMRVAEAYDYGAFVERNEIARMLERTHPDLAQLIRNRQGEGHG